MNTQGIGLGLHICKIIINEFGGDIHVESELGKGSNFIFLIDLEENQQVNQISYKRRR